jgi:hypothetical protein
MVGKRSRKWLKIYVYDFGGLVSYWLLVIGYLLLEAFSFFLITNNE